jgi:zinc transport system permease protein
MEFLNAVLEQGFLRNALLAGVLASIGCGLIGPYVVVRRIGYIAGGIAHAVLGAMGFAYYLGVDPLAGALVGAVIAALVIGWVNLRLRAQEDMLIAALWASGMAAGVLFLSRSAGYRVDLMSYLFGNILLVSPRDLWLMAGLDAVIAVLVAGFYRQFLAVCFDEEFASLRGVRVTFFYLLLLCMVSLTVVLLIQVVGLILVLALISLPAALAGQWVTSLARMMLVATGVGLLVTFGGLAASYAPDLPAGAVIVLLTSGLYVASTVLRAVVRR